jgi:hypothetical protein
LLQRFMRRFGLRTFAFGATVRARRKFARRINAARRAFFDMVSV